MTAQDSQRWLDRQDAVHQLEATWVSITRPVDEAIDGGCGVHRVGVREGNGISTFAVIANAADRVWKGDDSSMKCKDWMDPPAVRE